MHECSKELPVYQFVVLEKQTWGTGILSKKRTLHILWGALVCTVLPHSFSIGPTTNEETEAGWLGAVSISARAGRQAPRLSGLGCNHQDMGPSNHHGEAG